MTSRILILIATLAIVGVAGCSSGLQETPMMPPAGGPAAPQSSGPSASPDQSDTSDLSSDDTVPVSEVPKATKPPRQSAKPSNAPSALVKATQPTQTALRYACRHPAQPGRRECDAILVARTLSACNRSAPYCASDLQAAYGLARAARTNGKGVSVAVIGAYGYPNASGDLAVYRKRMGLRACSVASHCLRVVNQFGQATPLPKGADSADDWRAQAALDLDMVSAICPLCRIVLVQTNSNKDADLAAGVNAAAALGAAAIANSYSGNEGNAADAAYTRGGRAIVASAGNDGAGGKEPCGYSAVVCVGATTLSASGRGWSERAWRRAPGAVISAVGDPQTGVAFYESTGGGWQQAGGTGVSTPVVAALFALGPNSARMNAPAWITHHDAGRLSRAATKMGIVK